MKTKLFAFMGRLGEIETGYLYTALTPQTLLLIQRDVAVIVVTNLPIRTLDYIDFEKTSFEEVSRFPTNNFFAQYPVLLRRTVFDKSFYQSLDDDRHRVMNWQPSEISTLGQLSHPSTVLLNPQFTKDDERSPNFHQTKLEVQCKHLSKVNASLSMARLMVAEATTLSDIITKNDFDLLCTKYKPLSTKPVQGADRFVTQLPDNSEVVSVREEGETFRLFVSEKF
jgi:hypothetical protein